MKARRSSACEGYSLESDANVVRYSPDEYKELASYEHLRWEQRKRRSSASVGPAAAEVQPISV